MILLILRFNINGRVLFSFIKISDMRTVSHKESKVLKIIADHPIPLCCSLYYYEVNITAKSQCGYVVINIHLNYKSIIFLFSLIIILLIFYRSLRVGFTFDEAEKAKYNRGFYLSHFE